MYSAKRNDPGVPGALSGLSPYFHFGQLAPQRAALEAAKHKAKHKESVEGFLEVRGARPGGLHDTRQTYRGH